ncbi:MAG: hypothetical protein ACMG6H_08845 [Acidobacteriota bacterium]
MKHRLFFLSIHVLLPLAAGGFVYICWRDPNLLMFKWFGALGLEPSIESLRLATSGGRTAVPHWLIYSLPDGLWVYALTALMIILWRGTDSLPTKVFWLSAGLLLGAGSELGQLAGVLPGAFDTIDLLVCLLAPAAALFFTSRKFILNRSPYEAF